MLADAKDVEPDLIGELDLLQQLPQPQLRRDRAARLRIARRIGERVEPDLHYAATASAWRRIARLATPPRTPAVKMAQLISDVHSASRPSSASSE
jgi:hypothetical protein